jgi:hypothetical protein
MPDNPRISEIAARIHSYLKRMEYAQSDRDSKDSLYRNASAYRQADYVMVCYRSNHYTFGLTRNNALSYLQWLDAGNRGRHQQALGKATKRIRQKEVAMPAMWQPIETAPKDGTLVDLWYIWWVASLDGFDGRRLTNGYWSKANDEVGHWATREKEMPVNVKFTHWMPIPEPPK